MTLFMYFEYLISDFMKRKHFPGRKVKYQIHVIFFFFLRRDDPIANEIFGFLLDNNANGTRYVSNEYARRLHEMSRDDVNNEYSIQTYLNVQSLDANTKRKEHNILISLNRKIDTWI